jgi:hypothetical protein
LSGSVPWTTNENSWFEELDKWEKKEGLEVHISPYRDTSKVPLDVFRQFIEAIEGEAIKVTNQDFSSLTQLCDEFGFETLPTSKILRTQRLEAEFQHWTNEFRNRTGGLRPSKRTCRRRD